MKRIVVASTNENKVLELQTVASRYELHLDSPNDCQNEFLLNAPPIVEEIGQTFAENALLKAKAFAHWSGQPALGDDSGLEVEGLGGAPGIFSARYGRTDDDKIQRVLNELALIEEKTGISNRKAHFRCALALFIPETGEVFQTQSTLTGEILKTRQGAFGFGYDPIVLIHELQKTLAELDFETTCRVGFRAIAAKKLFTLLTNHS